MRLYEYEGKMLFRRYGIPVPESVLVRELAELDKVVYPVVLKAQALVGGRGKAGAVETAESRAEAEAKLGKLLKMVIAGFPVQKVLIERKVEIEKELYLSVTIDRAQHKPLLIASSEGGMEIEQIAKQRPEAIMKRHFEVGERPGGYLGRTVAGEIGLSGAEMSQAGAVINSVYNLFLDCDCKLVEINPLVVTKEGKILALDAKVDLDEDAMYRHPEFKEAPLHLKIEARHEVGELTEREKVAKAAGIPYVDLDGDIGVFPGGAGFGIASIDLIERFRGKAANFMDSGGAPTQERLRLMIGLLMDNPKVKAIFGARFGGISRCDDWAKAVVQYVLENKPEKPMIMRMAGNMEEEGRKIIEQAKQEQPQLFKSIKVYAYDTPIEEVIKETIRVARGGA